MENSRSPGASAALLGTLIAKSIGVTAGVALALLIVAAMLAVR